MSVSVIDLVEIAVLPDQESPPKPGRVMTPLSVFAGRGGLRDVAGIPPGSTWAVVVFVQDTDGRRGSGSVGFGHPSSIATIEQLAHHLLGRDPADRNQLWELMYRSTLNVGRRGSVLQAISALDIALWDLFGLQCGRPVYELLGGAVHESLRCYASWLYARDDLDDLAAEARMWVDAGFTALKQRFGYGPEDGAAGIRKNVELIKTVVDAAGPDVDVMADAYMSWDLGYATRCIRAIEDAGLRLRWVEEALPPDDVLAFGRLRRSVSTPLSTGEHEGTRWGFRDLIRHEAVDVLQPDVNRMGGITEARRVWALGESHGLDVVPHVNAAHNMHLSISSLNTPVVEYMPPPFEGVAPDEDQVFWTVYPDEPQPENGRIQPPRGDGLGVTPDPELLQPVATISA